MNMNMMKERVVGLGLGLGSKVQNFLNTISNIFCPFLFMSLASSCLLMSPYVSLCFFMSPCVSCVSSCLVMSFHVSLCLLTPANISLFLFMSPSLSLDQVKHVRPGCCLEERDRERKRNGIFLILENQSLCVA